MSRKSEKITRAAHIKKNTMGTSNEISFSVLDATKAALDSAQKGEKHDRRPLFGAISLFTLPGKKKAVSTPTKPEGLPLSSGDFITTSLGDANYGVVGELGAGVSASSGAGINSGIGAANLAAGVSTNTSIGAGSNASVSNLGGASAGTGTSNSTPSWIAPEDEIRHRKAIRRRHRLFAKGAIAIAAVVVIAIVFSQIYSAYLSQRSYVDSLHGVLEIVESTDDALLALDKEMSVLLDDESGAAAFDGDIDYTKVISDAKSARNALVSASNQVSALIASMPESVDKEAANQTASDISARISMIDTGSALLNEANSAGAVAAKAQDAWDAVLKADATARESVELVSDTSVENVNASIKKTNEAIDEFTQADEKFADLSSAYGGLDFSDWRAYIAKRIESLGYAIASNEAYLARNKEETAAQNDAYNATDEKAAEMAADLPASIGVAVYNAWAENTEKSCSNYKTARSEASAADAFLRDYLGTTSK